MVAEFSSNVRRDDFRLRSKYPFLKTRIFYTGGYNYFIYLENLKDFSFLSFEEINQEFDKRIRIMGNPSFLTENIPENFTEEIPTIKDEDISKNFEGAFFTHNSAIHFLKAKFNNYKIKNMYTDFAKKLFVVILDYSSNEEKERLQKELDKLRLTFSFAIEKAKEEDDDFKEEEIKTGNPKADILLNADHIMEIPAYNMQPVKLDFIKRDETLWFENIDKVYSGEFTKDELGFWDKNKSACYMDFTNASNIDIRNNLLMYDTIYMSIPLKESNDLLFTNTFSKDNFFSLVEKNRLKIVNVQPEERLDTDILKEAYSINHQSVVNRRALSLLSVIDLYETNKNFIFNDEAIQPYLLDFAKELSAISKIEINDIMNFFYWPKQALRESFEMFNRGGIWAYSHIGINHHIEKQVSRIFQKDLSLEFMMFSQNINLANALNATYFPSFLYSPNGKMQSLGSPYSSLIGNFLNFYKSATPTTIKSFYDLENTKLKTKEFISPIDIFDVNTYIPFEEFDKYTDSSTTRNALKVLFDRLSSLDLDERRIEIKKYNEQIKELESKNRFKLILSDCKNDIFGQIIPYVLASNPAMLLVFSIFNSGLLKGIYTRTNEYKTIRRLTDNLNNYINAQNGKLSDVDILSQINRVAKLRE